MSLNLFDKLAESCSYLLNNYPAAKPVKDYLNLRLTEASQTDFQFGYFPESDNFQCLFDLIGETELIDNQIIYSRYVQNSISSKKIFTSYFENYPMMIPFKDHYGEVVAMVGRTLLSEEDRKSLKIAKYKNTVFKKGDYLFGLYENKKGIIESGCAYIVEGQFDVIKAYERGFRNVVAIGSANLSSKQLGLITRYVDTVYLLLDNDEAGIKGREKAISKFGSQCNIKNCFLPDQYKDIDEYLSNVEGNYLDLTIK